MITKAYGLYRFQPRASLTEDEFDALVDWSRESGHLASALDTDKKHYVVLDPDTFERSVHIHYYTLTDEQEVFLELKWG
jgi:hypothetical protein